MELAKVDTPAPTHLLKGSARRGRKDVEGRVYRPHHVVVWVHCRQGELHGALDNGHVDEVPLTIQPGQVRNEKQTNDSATLAVTSHASKNRPRHAPGRRLCCPGEKKGGNKWQGGGGSASSRSSRSLGVWHGNGNPNGQPRCPHLISDVIQPARAGNKVGAQRKEC